MLLMELYDQFINKRSKEKFSDNFSLTDEEFSFLFIHDKGRFINLECCMLEFYFLLLCEEYDLALLLLDQTYAKPLKDDLNDMFIGDEINLLQQILMNPEIVKTVIELSLMRQLDGIAL